MKKMNWRLRLGIGLVLLSAALYFGHWLIYRDAHHIFIYLIGDIAFIPVEVLLVTLIIHEVLAAREKRAMLQKMNMVIGAFFSEVGTRLLKDLAAFDADAAQTASQLVVSGKWTDAEFRQARTHRSGCECKMDCSRGSLAELKGFLVGKRSFLLGLLQNPNLLEHETFTDLLWAVTHLAEELDCRGDVRQLSPADSAHLAGDIKRAYALLIAEWLDYMKHLKTSYPYLFSLAVRTNPFDPAATPEVK